MIQACYSAVIDHPVETVWSRIRDFNNYPAYIDGVSESVIEDGKGGDEVGAIRRFCYLGNWVRQSLVEHSDEQRTLTYQGLEPLPFPSGLRPGPVFPTDTEARRISWVLPSATGPSSWSGVYVSSPSRETPISG